MVCRLQLERWRNNHGRADLIVFFYFGLKRNKEKADPWDKDPLFFVHTNMVTSNSRPILEWIE